jgi:hypothetical protein
MKKTLTLALAVLIMSTFVTAQGDSMWSFSRQGKKSVFLELGGNGFMLTLNYEKFFTNRFGIRLGGLLVPAGEKPTFIGTVMGTTAWGEGKWCMETGLGVTLIAGGFMDVSTDGSENSLFVPTGTLGVRYQPRPKGLLLRFSFTPMVFPSGFWPWVGLSIGYSF